MAVSSREIRRRIKSVKNIRQITKAMELVAAAKMRKAQSAASSSRPYAVLSAEILKNLGERTQQHPLIKRPQPEGLAPQNKFLMIVISSDRGLAGSLNTNVINKTMSVIREHGTEKFDFIAVGRKSADAIRRLRGNIIAAFSMKDKGITVFDAKPIAKIAIEDFLSYRYDKVFVVYTDFISMLVQKPSILQLLPLVEKETIAEGDFLFEPDPQEVLENLVHRAIEFAVYQTLLEATASEHSARMVAMQNANSAAGDLIDDLTLSANQARQAGITRELAEISAAKLAMEN